MQFRKQAFIAKTGPLVAETGYLAAESNCMKRPKS
jgi:hypothetical protein